MILHKKTRMFEDNYVRLVEIIFEPTELWVGLCWENESLNGWKKWNFHLYICLIPMFPLHIMWRRKRCG